MLTHSTKNSLVKEIVAQIHFYCVERSRILVLGVIVYGEIVLHRTLADDLRVYSHGGISRSRNASF